MNNSWKLVNEDPTFKRWKDDKNNELIEDYDADVIEKIHFYEAKNDGNGWDKVFQSNGEIWLKIWHNAKLVCRFLIGTVKSNEKHELKANE